MTENILTADRLKELVNYDPDTGVFTRRVRTAQRHQVGDRADFVVSSGHLAGYCRVSVDSKRFMAHRCAWLYMYGEWPKQDIDHINGDKSDNRICNLRDVSNQTNRENLRKPHKDSESKFLGVYLHNQGKWVARIQTMRKMKHIGMFDTPEEAHQAYLIEKRKLHSGCTI